MLKALKDTIIAKLILDDERSGITYKLEEPYDRGEVVSVNSIDEVSIGDIIIFDRQCENKYFELDGDRYVKVVAKDIICKDDGTTILNKLLIEEHPDYESTAGGIYIPEEFRNGSCFGKVVKAGSGNIGLNGNRVPITVLEGEYVFYSQWKKIEVTINDIKYAVTREDSIMAIIDNIDLDKRIERSKWRI